MFFKMFVCEYFGFEMLIFGFVYSIEVVVVIFWVGGFGVYGVICDMLDEIWENFGCVCELVGV